MPSAVLKLTIELDREVDGRWIAEVMEVSGAMAYGRTQTEAAEKAVRVAVQAFSEREGWQ